MSGRPPIFSVRIPAGGANTSGTAVHGSSRRPAASGEYPWAVWKYWAIRKIDPNIPKYMQIDAKFAAENARLRKNRIGTIGDRARSSHRTNAAITARPPTTTPDRAELVQPAELAWINAHTSANRPTLTSARPPRSRLSYGPRLSSSFVNATGTRAIPIGTLSQKIQCQEIPCVIAPPTTGPAATESPETPVQMPRASPRRCAGNAWLSSVRVSGVTSAPPAPWKTRATTSAWMLGDSAAAADAHVKIATPMQKRSRLP